MNNNKNGLDEMQKQRRNGIGNQMFMLMFWAVFLNCGLHGAGITWLPYPANVIVIISACMGIYLIRLIAANAYLPTQALNRKGIIGLVIAIVFSIALAVTAINYFGLSAERLDGMSDNSALILFIISTVGLIGALIMMVVKKVSDKNDKED